jgi:hypothetical protein
MPLELLPCANAPFLLEQKISVCFGIRYTCISCHRYPHHDKSHFPG